MFASRAFRIAILSTVFTPLIFDSMAPAMAQESEPPVAPEFHVPPFEFKPSAGSKTIDGHGLGYVPPLVDLSHLTGDFHLAWLQ